MERFVKEERIVVARMSVTEGTYECHWLEKCHIPYKKIDVAKSIHGRSEATP